MKLNKVNIFYLIIINFFIKNINNESKYFLTANGKDFGFASSAHFPVDFKRKKKRTDEISFTRN